MSVENMENKPLNEGYVSNLVDKGLETYKWAKDSTLQNKTLGPRVGPIVNFAEEKVVAGLKASPVKVEDVVTAIDTRIGATVNYTSDKVAKAVQVPIDARNKTLTFVHDKIKTLKVDESEEESKDSGEVPEVRTILIDAKSVTAERFNLLLDASEGYLAQYLPPAETSEEEPTSIEGSTKEIRPVANRALRLSKVAAKRMQERAFSKVGQLQKRTANVVHVDLVKYSEWLDLEGKKETIIVTMNKVDERVVQPTKEKLNEQVDKVKELVEKTTDTINTKVVEPTRVKLEPIYLPVQDKVIRVWTTLGDTYNDKVVKPRDDIIKMFRDELKEQQELAKMKSGDDQMTIQAGLQAVIAAARTRLSREWEVRISPSLEKFMGRGEDNDDEEELGDADSSVADESE